MYYHFNDNFERDYGFHNLGKGLHRHQNHKFLFSRIYIGEETRIFLRLVFFFYISMMTPPYGMDTCAKEHKFYNLGEEHLGFPKCILE